LCSKLNWTQPTATVNIFHGVNKLCESVGKTIGEMTSGRPFIQPQLVTDSSDDNNDDDDFQPSERPKRRNLKTTDVKNGGAGVRTSNRSNGDSVAAPQLAKNPLADSDSDLEEILPEPPKKKQEDGSPEEEPKKKNLRSNKRPPPPQKKSGKKGGSKKPAKRPRRAKKGGDSNSDDEDFDPGSEDEEEDGSDDDADEASVHSEDLSPEENISDSDFVPSDEADEGAKRGGSDEDADETIHLSSDGESPAPKKAGTAAARNNENIQTFDPNSAVREK
jgi:hypothetical protein